MKTFNVKTFDVKKFDKLLKPGLCRGTHKGNMFCIEAAVSIVLGESEEDDPDYHPSCVARHINEFKVDLNDRNWSTPQARAKGLRDLGLAQLGSVKFRSDEFDQMMIDVVKERIICPKIAQLAKDGDIMAIENLVRHFEDCDATDVSNLIAYIKKHSPAPKLVKKNGKLNAAQIAKLNDWPLFLVANLALEALTRMKSPGIQLLTKKV